MTEWNVNQVRQNSSMKENIHERKKELIRKQLRKKRQGKREMRGKIESRRTCLKNWKRKKKRKEQDECNEKGCPLDAFQEKKTISENIL